MKKNGKGRWQALVVFGLLVHVGAGREVAVKAPPGDAAGAVLVQGTWGSERGQFGKADEASRPGPMDFAVHDKTVYVLDTVNARVQVFDKDSGLVKEIAIETETADFLDVDATGRIAVLDAFTRHEFKVFAPSGALQQHARLPEAIRLASAIQLGADQVWIEERHNRVFAIAATDGAEARVQQSLPGRPVLRDRSLHASLTPDGAVRVRIAKGEQTESTFDLGIPGQVRSIVGLETDDREHIYVAVRREDVTDAGRMPADLVIAKLSLEGRLLASAVLPDAYVTDHYRKIFVTSSGEVVQMQTAEEGVRFIRWTLDAPNGEGGQP